LKILLGAIVRLVREWDAKAMQVTNDEQANSLVDPP